MYDIFWNNKYIGITNELSVQERIMFDNVKYIKIIFFNISLESIDSLKTSFNNQEIGELTICENNNPYGFIKSTLHGIISHLNFNKEYNHITASLKFVGTVDKDILDNQINTGSVNITNNIETYESPQKEIDYNDFIKKTTELMTKEVIKESKKKVEEILKEEKEENKLKPIEDKTKKFNRKITL